MTFQELQECVDLIEAISGRKAIIYSRKHMTEAELKEVEREIEQEQKLRDLGIK